MIRNYFVIAFRHLVKDKVFSFINIFGLSLAIGASVLIFQYAYIEFRYDKYHEHAENLYRVSGIQFENGRPLLHSASVPLQVGPALSDQFSQVIRYTRLISTRGWFDCALEYKLDSNVKIFNEHGLYFADSDFFRMFSYTFVKGDEINALRNPFSIVLSRTAAQKYFGQEDPIGKVVHLHASFQQDDYTVTGVIEDPRQDSHIDADIILSLSSLEMNRVFNKLSSYTYLQLAPGTDATQLIKKFPDVVASFLKPTDQTIGLDIHSITKIHLNQALEDEMKQSGSSNAIYFLILIAIIILIVAWINYINLNIARSLSRAKEIGVRKISGATKLQLSYQFATEALIVNIGGVAAGLVLVKIFAGDFYQQIGVASAPFESLNIVIGGVFAVGLLLVGVSFTGVYPSRVLASMNPSLVLKGKIVRSAGGQLLSKSLIVFQFATSIGLSIAVVVFAQQFGYVQTQNMGIDIGQTLIVRAPVNTDSTYKQKLDVLKTRLSDMLFIQSVSSSSALPGESNSWTGPVRRRKEKTGERDYLINIIDPSYIHSYKLKILAGRNFSENDYPILEHFGAKVEPVILNQLGIAAIGFDKPEDAINQTVFWNDNECRIIGVIEDYHQQSLKNAVQPVLLIANNGPMLSLKFVPSLSGNRLHQAIESINSIWSTAFPSTTFDYFFLDDFITRQYSDDRQVAILFNMFCVLAIIISCLGLFGLSFFQVAQRTKEVSVRKVLGATTVSLVRLMTKESMLLIVISSFIAIPLAYLGVHQWLENFAFHIDLTPVYFVIPVLIILFIAFMSIVTHTLRTVTRNASETLKQD